MSAHQDSSGLQRSSRSCCPLQTLFKCSWSCNYATFELQIGRMTIARSILILLGSCILTKNDLKSLDFVINRFFVKLFRTSNTETVKHSSCTSRSIFKSVIIEKRTNKIKESLTKVNYLYIPAMFEMC